MAPKKTTKPKPQPLGIDLSTFCAQIDDYTGRPAGTVEETVRTYRQASDMLKLTNSNSVHRKTVVDALERFIKSRNAVINSKPIVRTRTGGTERRVLRSRTVEKALPELWAQSRDRSTVTSISAPTPLAEVTLQPLFFVTKVWSEYERLKLLSSRANRQVEAERTALRAIFEEVDEVWSGDPKITTDGWVLGWNHTERFSETRCREHAQLQGIDLSDVEEVAFSAVRTIYEINDAYGTGPDEGADREDSYGSDYKRRMGMV